MTACSYRVTAHERAPGAKYRIIRKQEIEAGVGDERANRVSAHWRITSSPLFLRTMEIYFLTRESRGSLIRVYRFRARSIESLYRVPRGRGGARHVMRNMTMDVDAKSNGCARHDNYVKLPPRISGRLLNFTLVPPLVCSAIPSFAPFNLRVRTKARPSLPTLRSV